MGRRFYCSSLQISIINYGQAYLFSTKLDILNNDKILGSEFYSRYPIHSNSIWGALGAQFEDSNVMF